MSDAVISTAIPTAITAEYEIGDTLGTGHFSKVKLGIHRQTGEKVAVKVWPGSTAAKRGVPSDCLPLFVQIIQKPTGSKIAMLKAEVDILTRCDHPNVYAVSCLALRASTEAGQANVDCGRASERPLLACPTAG